MTDTNRGNGAVVKERVRQLEDRVEKMEDGIKVFDQTYNADRTWQAEWRGKLEVTLSGLAKGLDELKASLGRRKSDRVKIMVAVVASAGALVATLVDKLF